MSCAKTLDDNTMLKEQVSALIAERESLKVLNASLAEKNEFLSVKLQKLVDTGKELQASLLATLHTASTSACVHLNENDRDEEEQWEHIECRQRSCAGGERPPVPPADDARWNVYEQTWNETVAQRTERERLEQEQEDKYKTIEERDALWRRQHEEYDAMTAEVSDDERLDQECSYCCQMDSICGGDHGDDMRWEQQEHRRRRD